MRSAQGKHAQVEVITAAEAPDASGTLWLGVRFAMELGWHIYWVNPGDSGGPPTATTKPYGCSVKYATGTEHESRGFTPPRPPVRARQSARIGGPGAPRLVAHRPASPL